VTIHDRDGCGHHAQVFQFGQRAVVRRDVTIGKFDVVLPKELLRPVAEQSARLRLEDDRVRHDYDPIAAFSFSVMVAMGGTPPL
jgi:hypothetical protein